MEFNVPQNKDVQTTGEQVKFKSERLGRQDPSCSEHSSIEPSAIQPEINASVSTELPLQHGAKIWVQEVMSLCMPVRDKSAIPTKPFPKINKQNPPSSHLEFPVSFSKRANRVSTDTPDVCQRKTASSLQICINVQRENKPSLVRVSTKQRSFMFKSTYLPQKRSQFPYEGQDLMNPLVPLSFFLQAMIPMDQGITKPVQGM